jgi:hypothetical protein
VEIEITMTATVKRVSGPEISDPVHITAWTVADGQWYNGNKRPNAIDFEVCPAHADPDECLEGCIGNGDGVSTYRLTFVSADYVTLSEIGTDSPNRPRSTKQETSERDAKLASGLRTLARGGWRDK